MSKVITGQDGVTDTSASLAEFDPRSGNIIERLLFNNRLLIVGLCLLMTAFFTFQARHLTLNAAYDQMIPSGHPFIENFMQHRNELAGMGNALRIAVAVEEGTIFDAKYLDTLRKLNDDLFLLPGVDRPYMKSLWAPAVRWTGVTEDGLDGGPVIPDDYDGTRSSLDQVRVNVERSGEIGHLVADNYRSSIIMVPLQDTVVATGEPIDYHALSGQIEELRGKYEADGISIHVTGFAKVMGDLIDGLVQMLLFFVVAIVICTLVLYWYTRCVRSTLLVVLCSLIGVIWLLGLLPTLGYQLDPYSVLVPFLIFAIGVSHGSQKMNGIMQDIGRGMHQLVAARYTFRRLFLAGVTALVSDAIGFAVLMVIDIPVIQGLAITASLGVALLIVTNLVLLPILLSFTGVSPAATQRSLRTEIQAEEGGRKHFLWAFLDRFTRQPWAGIIVALGVVCAGVGIVVGSKVQVGDTDQGAPELRSDSRYNQDNSFMVSNYAASSDVFIVMITTPQYACAHYDTLRVVDALERELQQLPSVDGTSSLAGLSKVASAGMNEGSLKWYDVPRSQGLLNAIVTRAPREMFNQNCDLLTVFAYLKDHKADTLTSVVETVESFAERYGTDEIRILNAAGNAGVDAATNIVVEKANQLMLYLVYLAVIIVCFITFRSWRAVVCAIVPLMVTSLLAEALMVWLNIGVKVATLPVIALGVGVGVDYALYVMTMVMAYIRQGAPLSHAYYRALVSTGKVVILTGVTLGIAVITWIWSPIKFQADMGIMLAFMFIWNMLGALILLPALAYFLFRSQARPEQA